MICSSSSEDDDEDETIPDFAPKGTGQGGGKGQLQVPNGSAQRYAYHSKCK